MASSTAKLLRNVPLPDEISTVHDNAAVIDLGTGSTRVGFAGDDAPRLVYPTVTAEASDQSFKECFSVAYQNRDRLLLSRVLERGIVRQWNEAEMLLQHLDNLLGLSKDTNTPVLLTESALAPKEQRERMIELLFETIKCSGVYFSAAPVLGLYASGRSTGLVCDMGFGLSSSVPIFEGFPLFHSILQMQMGGHDLTQWLGEQLHPPLTSLPPYYHYEVWQYLKEMYGTTALDRAAYASAASNASKDNRKGEEICHKLPDGESVRLGIERYALGEAFFDPSVVAASDAHHYHQSMRISQSTSGIAVLAATSAAKCDGDILPQLYSNIVVTGAASLTHGFVPRLERELQLATAESEARDRVRVIATTERESAAFVGGSILASLPTFQDMWITGAQYEEIGSSVALRNCF